MASKPESKERRREGKEKSLRKGRRASHVRGEGEGGKEVKLIQGRSWTIISLFTKARMNQLSDAERSRGEEERRREDVGWSEEQNRTENPFQPGRPGIGGSYLYGVVASRRMQMPLETEPEEEGYNWI